MTSVLHMKYDASYITLGLVANLCERITYCTGHVHPPFDQACRQCRKVLLQADPICRCGQLAVTNLQAGFDVARWGNQRFHNLAVFG